MTERPESPAPQDSPRPSPTTLSPPEHPPHRMHFGIFATIRRIVSAVLVLLMVFLIGFYVGLFSFGMGDKPVPRVYRPGEGLEKVAIVPIDGLISGATVDHVRSVVDAVIEDPYIKAVVLRVESPGGGASASDQILHELSRLKDKGLPVIASYGGVAASGGYYVSCQADMIFAEPTCTTGSIGVIAQVPTLQILLEEKLGVKFETITAGGSPQKDVGNNMYRNWNEADRAVMQKMVDAIHGRFIEVVAEGRKAHLTAEQAAALADGSVYTAQEAVENKLVDEVGYLDAALAQAIKAGGFAEAQPPIVIYRQPVSLTGLLGLHGPAQGASSLPLERLLDGARARQWINEFSVPQILMMGPL